MRSRTASSNARSWISTLASIVLLIGARALASTSPPHEYHVLSPEPLNGAVSVMSLEPNNTITVGGTQVTLQQYQRATIPPTAFTSGSKFTGSGFFTVGSSENAADLLVPDDFAGTSFVVPHIAGSHKYFLLSPSGTAQVTVQLGANRVQTAGASTTSFLNPFREQWAPQIMRSGGIDARTGLTVHQTSASNVRSMTVSSTRTL